MSGLSPERWEQVSSILDEVLELPPGDVEPALDELCGDDTELRREVEIMLDACARAEHLMERPPALNVKGIIGSLGNPDRGKIEPGDLVGAYRIIELLGRGGMGAVYLAERADGEFERRVALKVVKRGMDSEEIIDRFRSERQILAGLEHPNIASLLDGGITADGRPFFAMELASGEPIDAYCDRMRLTLRQRIELFLVVCDAVQHAHRNLIVHRDLKPGNVVVTSDGEVKLLDFGIAKVLDPSHGSDQRTTALGVRLTPEYAAPEQIVMGPTTTATDVYSLGVVLYELLSGKRPYVFTNGSMSEIEDLVCKTDPRRPSTRVVFRDSEAKEETSGLPRSSWLRSTNPGALRQSLSGDLDSIILKALEKEPQRRYGSAAELKQDLENYIHGHPVEARAQTRVYRLGKFVRRNAVVVALGTAAVLALAGGAGVAEWQRQRAAAAAVRAERTRDFVVSVFQKFDPNVLSGREMNPRNLVTEGLSILDTVEGQPLLKAGSLGALGQIAFNLGERNLADSIFILTLSEPLDDDAAGAPLRATALSGRGRILNERTDLDAVGLLRQAVSLREGPVESDPLLQSDLIELAFALSVHGAPGGEERTEATRILEELATVPLNPLLDGRRLEYRADLFYYDSAMDSSRSYYEASIRTRREGLGPNHPEIGQPFVGLSVVSSWEGDLDAEQNHLRQAIELFENAYGERHPRVANTRYRLARSFWRQERFAEAIEEAERTLLAANPEDPTDHRTEAGALELKARWFLSNGDLPAAFENSERMIAVTSQAGSILEHTEINRYILHGEILARSERLEDAVRALLAGITVAPPEGRGAAYTFYLNQKAAALRNLIDLEESLGRTADAETHRDQLRQIEDELRQIEEAGSG